MDFIPTLDSDASDHSDDELPLLDPSFTFENDAFDPTLEWQPTTEPSRSVFSVNDIIARRIEANPALKRKRGLHTDSEHSESDNDTEQEDSDLPEHSEHSQQDSEDEESRSEAEELSKADFFAEVPKSSKAVHESFASFGLSRPLLKALSDVSFTKPTPIQSSAIPVALLGKDIVGAAVTGSGKTAAFLLPILERLIHRDKSKRAAATRCLILVPTRELAVQCFQVGQKLGANLDVQFCLLVGGLSLKAQETALRARPDVVIATPGRLIDHLHNSPNFSLDALDVLILDEADRMLEDGFHDELTEIVKSCPASRQTMLFSATMTDSVADLVKLSLSNPVKLFVDPKHTTAKGLTQEFVRVRSGKEVDRDAMLLALCQNTFKRRVIVFVRSKKLAHQLCVTFGLLGLSCSELHGDLSQEQRLASLQSFRDGHSNFLMATDLASRGLDIKGIDTVINYDMPSQMAQYLHRVGRTARAGKRGRSITLVGEADRKILKMVIKNRSGEDSVKHRVIPLEALAKCIETLKKLEADVSGVLEEEKEERAIRKAEMELKKGQNMIQHEKEIFSRPARVWFQSSQQKESAAKTSKDQYQSKFQSAKDSDESKTPKIKRDNLAGLSRKAKRRKLAQQEDDLEQAKHQGSVNQSIRQAKKAQQPRKIGLQENRNAFNSKMKGGKKKKKTQSDSKKSSKKTKFGGSKA